MNDSDHSTEDQNQNSLSSSQGSEPRFPWEVPSGEAEPVDRGAERISDAKGFHFAEAGKIDVLAKIGRLRRETEKAFRERDSLRRRVAELEKEREELRAQLTSSKLHSDTLLEKEVKWEAENRRRLVDIEELKNRLSAAESERDDLAAQIEVAKATMSDITNALDWGHDFLEALPPESEA